MEFFAVCWWDAAWRKSVIIKVMNGREFYFWCERFDTVSTDI